MKNRWTSLPLSYRIMLCLQLFLIALFLVLYATLGSVRGTQFQGVFLRCRAEENVTTYTGRSGGVTYNVTVTSGIGGGWPTVEFQRGSTLYGPYTIADDPTVVLEDPPLNLTEAGLNALRRVEIRSKDRVIYRGGYSGSGFLSIFYPESGYAWSAQIGECTERGPNAADILRFALGPQCFRRAHTGMFLLGAAVSLFNFFTILYYEDLFRFSMRLRSRDVPYDAQPTALYLFGNWAVWIVMTCFALLVYIRGLTDV